MDSDASDSSKDKTSDFGKGAQQRNKAGFTRLVRKELSKKTRGFTNLNYCTKKEITR